jgi:ribosomal-protein-alanine N-acetyltransferase
VVYNKRGIYTSDWMWARGIQMERQTKIKCNCCGQSIPRSEAKEPKQDYLKIEKKWGYFSNKDLEKHTINVCEPCYDKWITSFKLPVQIDEIIEIFPNNE